MRGIILINVYKKIENIYKMSSLKIELMKFLISKLKIYRYNFYLPKSTTSFFAISMQF